ncbi:uracil-DNA glycosylase [Sinimarinibacterium sp. NLF-5-8]|uniref:uracil-DNA glycosylase n=1 Tax=Sinimarinibacterium sp. NLF-5-8 TaxID=2698684 RepID=UPI00137BA52D|nr:uracil-DNA glycosylase [Sinimarinibacterium sp. NLF-5-8]QHS08729.1 uracil-DNA glycosylase [Sinimarinibacterium sp. NLF-5-8]
MDSARRQLYLRRLGLATWRLREDGDVNDIAPEPVSGSSEPLASSVQAAPDPVAESPVADLQAKVVVVQPAVHRVIPTDWGGLRAAVADCTACKLCETRRSTVFGVGSEHAPLMVIGEGPGQEEDARGEPFVGAAGRLLDQMLKTIGRSRTQASDAQAVFIANVVKCRPPGNRDPQVDEVEACRPYLDRQIELVQPKLIVALGRVAAQRLLATDAPLSRLRGKQHFYGANKIPVFVTYHPAYLLRSPGEKAKSWQDLKHIHRQLAELV